VSLSTSHSALGGPWAEAFTTDGIASESNPLLGVHPSPRWGAGQTLRGGGTASWYVVIHLHRN